MAHKSEKYWIKTGVRVQHQDYPEYKMTVDRVRHKVQEDKSDDPDPKDGFQKIKKNFILGVDVHWIDDNGGYQKGTFQTTELVPWPET